MRDKYFLATTDLVLQASSDEESGSDDSGSDKISKPEEDSADSDDSSEDESEEEAPPKKRKAETETAPVAKKAKTEVAAEGGNESNNLFVGSLSWNVDEDWLTREFETFGALAGVRVITDKESGRSKGFVT